MLKHAKVTQAKIQLRHTQVAHPITFYGSCEVNEKTSSELSDLLELALF
jgi:hypothetical protein